MFEIIFFGYRRSYSLTQVLLETGLPCFETVMHIAVGFWIVGKIVQMRLFVIIRLCALRNIF